AGWTQRLANSDAVRPAFRDALARFLVPALRWLGRPEAEGVSRLAESGIVGADPDALRQAYLGRVGPVLAEARLASELGLEREGEGWSHADELDWEAWDDARRRGAAGGPDADTLARVRGDKNRAMLVE